MPQRAWTRAEAFGQQALEHVTDLPYFVSRSGLPIDGCKNGHDIPPQIPKVLQIICVLDTAFYGEVGVCSSCIQAAQHGIANIVQSTEAFVFCTA